MHVASQAFEPDEQLIKSSYELDQSSIRGENNDTAKFQIGTLHRF